MISRKKEILILGIILLTFIVSHLPGIDAPYHQDEYKWSFIIDDNSVHYDPGRIPHPPLGTSIYETTNNVFGNKNLRLAPTIFGLANLLLLFYLVRYLFSTRAALWAAGLYTLSFYSILASLTVDTDGAIMPFFALLSFIFYLKWKDGRGKAYLFYLVGALVLGFLIKASFALVPVALVLDFAFANNVFSDKKKFVKYFLFTALIGVAFVLLLLLARFIFPFFDLSSSVKYWEHFANFNHRGWFQTLIQLIKAILYSSPLLVLPLMFVNKEIFPKIRLFLFYIFCGLFFYLIAFDFSIGALDRYLQFWVVPLSIISGVVFAMFFSSADKVSKLRIFLLSGLAAIFFALQFISHQVPPLYPKTEWFSRALSFKWNALFPFMGGSGPVPFYISFLFIALVWVTAIGLVLAALKIKNFKKTALVGVLVLGIFYNVAFVEEYLFGKINGSAPDLIRETTAFIAENDAIDKVIVYNDNGGAEIVRMDKYRKRLYVDPKFDIEEKVASLNEFKEYYLVINIPKLDPASVYAKYFSTCKVIYEQTSGKIGSKVYDCRDAEDVTLGG